MSTKKRGLGRGLEALLGTGNKGAAPAPAAAAEGPAGEGLRVETGYGEGSRISTFYDPMIAKVIAHAPDRHTAIERLRDALQAFHVSGVKTNIPFVLRILDDEDFQAARLHTQLGAAIAARKPEAETA